MSGAELALHGDDERALARLMARARIVSKMPGLKRELAGNPDAVAGVMLSLEGYGLPVTAQGINEAFDWIEGKATLTAQTYQALARKNGYDIIPVVRGPERAIARVVKEGRPPIEVEFTVDDAKRAHRFDEWVERWTQVNGKNRKEVFVWRVDGRIRTRTASDGTEVPVQLPDWVKKEIDEGRVKRYDAWWNYRSDMLWKSAAKRAVKLAAPHVLLGVVEDDVHETVWEPATAGPAVDDDQVVDGEIVDVSDAQITADGDIADAELVEEPDVAHQPPRPASPEPATGRSAADPPQQAQPAEDTSRNPVPRPASPSSNRGEAGPAQTATAGPSQEGPAPAEELFGPDEEPF